MIHPGSTVGIIGGGQLGRMSALAAANLGLKVCIFTDRKDDPALQVSDQAVVGDYGDEAKLKEFAKKVDVVTFEFENIPKSSLEYLETHCVVRPNTNSLHISQNRLREKEFVNSLGFKTAPFRRVTSGAGLKRAFAELGGETCILKTAEFGYDGKGQEFVDANTDYAKLWKKMATKEAVLEGFVDFALEISVVVARGVDGELRAYVPSENIHKSGILDTTIAPARIGEEVADSAVDVAFEIADALDFVGVLAVEFFVTKDGGVVVNEMAPRPHNSGHWTLDACVTSQFEQFIRAVCGLPLGSAQHFSAAIMKNLIGDDVHVWQEFVADPEAKLHIYGKNEVREGRKMGHVTMLVGEADELISV